jgi:GT2 family glycosyltransferase
MSCLEALNRQTYKNFRVLVADNASDVSLQEEIFAILPGVKFIQNKFNYGFAEANNRLLEQVKDSQWLVLLNPDAYPEPTWLEQLMLAAKQYPGYSFFASRQLMSEDTSRLDGQGDVYHMSGLVWRDGYGKSISQQQNAKEVFSPCAAAAMYQTEKVLEVGGFDADYFCYVEDVDLGFRLRLIGERCLLVPSAVVKHYGSATTGGQHSDFSVYYGHRNIVWTYIKNMPGLLFWVFLPHHILLNVYSIFLFCFRGQGRVLLRAKKDALKGLPKMLKKRAKIQASRKASVWDILRVIDKSPIPKLSDYLRFR